MYTPHTYVAEQQADLAADIAAPVEDWWGLQGGDTEVRRQLTVSLVLRLE